MITITVPQPKYHSSITNVEYDSLRAALDAETQAEGQDLQSFRTFICTRRTMSYWHPENPELIDQWEAIIGSALKMFPECIHDCALSDDIDRYITRQRYHLMVLMNLKGRESAYAPAMEFLQKYYPVYWKQMQKVMVPPMVFSTVGIYAAHITEENGLDACTWASPLMNIDKLIDKYCERVARVSGPYIT